VNDLQATAISLAESGVSVLPLEPGKKRPLGRLVHHGHKDASYDVKVVKRWWEREPEANIGIACKQSSLVVFDIDRRNGGFRPEELPDTLTVGTPGGRHLYYAVADPFWRPAGEYRQGVDIKWDGYVVAPPSMHPDGRPYVTEEQRPMAHLPVEIFEALER